MLLCAGGKSGNWQRDEVGENGGKMGEVERTTAREREREIGKECVNAAHHP